MFKNGISILIIINFLFGDYYISFDFTSKNGVLTSYHFNCSKALTNSNIRKKLIFIIPVKSKNIKLICKNNQQKIINNLLRYQFFITSNDNAFNFKTKGVFLPKRFDIIIKNNKAYFYLKE